MNRHVKEKYGKPGRGTQGRTSLYANKRRCIHVHIKNKQKKTQIILRGPSQLFQTLKLVDDQETELIFTILYVVISAKFHELPEGASHTHPSSPTGPRPLAINLHDKCINPGKSLIWESSNLLYS